MRIGGAPRAVDTLSSFVIPHSPWLPVAGALLLYLVAMRLNPARASLRDGFRAVRRYRRLWLPIGGCGFAYALFQLALRWYFHLVLPPGDRPGFRWWGAAGRDPQWRFTGAPESVWYLEPGTIAAHARGAVLPALENVAGIFNCLVSTFPLSAFAALLLLLNYGGHHAVLWRALGRRFGRGGPAIYAGILLCALAALAKPFVYAVARHVDPQLWYQWSPVVVWLAFLFEYLLGVCIQIYLILLAYCWVRGISHTPRELFDFALRRFSSVVRWAAVVLLLSSLFIDLPLILKNFAPWARIFPDDPARIDFRLGLARSLLTVVLLATSTMQIALTFHGSSVRAALGGHLRFLRRHGWPCAWFLALAALHCHALEVLNRTLQSGLREGTALGLAWQLLFPWLSALVAAWLLASWVCLYRRCDEGRRADENWIAF